MSYLFILGLFLWMIVERDSVGSKLSKLSARVEALESNTTTALVATATTAPAPVPAAPQEAEPARATTPPALPKSATHTSTSIDALTAKLGSNVLAVVGGAFVIIGVLIFLTMAISNGWIGETGRVVLALLGGVALFGAGLWHGAGKAQEIAQSKWAFGNLAGVLVGTGTATVLLGAIVGSRVYTTFDTTVGLLIALLVGAASTWIATRWKSQDLAAFGIVSALAAPILVDAPANFATMGFVTIALIAAVVVLVQFGWRWLLSAALITTLPQLVDWASTTAPSEVTTLSAVLIGYWLIMALGALGFEIRNPVDRLRASAAGVLFVATASVVLIASDHMTNIQEERFYLLLAAFPAILSFLTIWRRKSNQAVGVFLGALAASVLAITLAQHFDGAALVTWWMAEAITFAWLYRKTDDLRALATMLIFTIFGISHVLMFDAIPKLLAYPTGDLQHVALSLSSLAIGLLAIGALATDSMRFSVHIRFASWYAASLSIVYLICLTIVEVLTEAVSRDALITLPLDSTAQLALVIAFSIAGFGYLAASKFIAEHRYIETVRGTAIGLSILGPLWLVVAQLNPGAEVTLWLTLAAVAAAVVARYWRLQTAVIMSCIFGACAAGHALLFDAPIWTALSTGVEDTPPAIIALALVNVTAIVMYITMARPYKTIRIAGESIRQVLGTAIAILPVLLISTIVVAFLTPEGVRLQGNIVDQEAQTALSIVWAIIGVGALMAALSKRIHAIEHIRIGAMILLGIAAAKVLLVDTSQLETPYRVMVFIGIGLLFLGGAYLDQKLRHKED